MIGLYGLIKGRVVFGPDSGRNEDDRYIDGWRARLVSLILLAAGGFFVFSRTVGLCLLVIAILLPWLLGKSKAL